MRVPRWLTVCLGLALAAPGSAFGADDSGPSLSWNVTLASRYLFQGVDFSNNNPVIQPEIGLTVRGVTFTAWANGDLDEGHFNEIDLLASYDLDVGETTVTPGYAYYLYPNRGDVDPSQEVYLDLARSIGVDLSLSIHYDFDEGDGAYGSAGVSREFETAGGALGAGVTLFYWREYYAQSGIPSIELATSFTREVGSLAITPSLSYFATWENADFRDAQAVPSKWWVAVSVGPKD
jgi:uncharacterized protein (TIGR02001 family)